MSSRNNEARALTNEIIMNCSTSIHAHLDNLYNDTDLLKRFCKALYRTSIINTIEICKKSDYDYIPNLRKNLRDKKLFKLNLLCKDEDYVERDGYELNSIDSSMMDRIADSLDEKPYFIQPIWANTEPKNALHIFDGVHRFLALLTRYNNGRKIPKVTLMPIMIPEIFDDNYTDMIVPDCIMRNIEKIIQVAKLKFNTDVEYSYITEYSYTTNGIKMYKIKCKGYKMVQLIIVAWSVCIDQIYRYQKEKSIDLIEADRIIHNKTVF